MLAAPAIDIRQRWELIDTQWDVNTDKSNAYADDPGINRYIVGCKWINTTDYQSWELRINRYIVGCKFS